MTKSARDHIIIEAPRTCTFIRVLEVLCFVLFANCVRCSSLCTLSCFEALPCLIRRILLETHFCADNGESFGVTAAGFTTYATWGKVLPPQLDRQMQLKTYTLSFCFFDCIIDRWKSAFANFVSPDSIIYYVSEVFQLKKTRLVFAAERSILSAFEIAACASEPTFAYSMIKLTGLFFIAMWSQWPDSCNCLVLLHNCLLKSRLSWYLITSRMKA
jgi:hypothetical protein